MNVKDNYSLLIQKLEKWVILNNIESMLGWDFETYMPPKGGIQRSKQLALLAGLIHEEITSQEINELLDKIKGDTNYNTLSTIEKRNIYLAEREYKKNTKVPKELVEQIAEQYAFSIQAWKKAKEKQDYSLFKPEFDKTLELAKKRAHYLNPNKEPFDALFDEFEPGMPIAMVNKLFTELKENLIPLIKKCQKSSKQPDISLIKRRCPQEIQKKLDKDISKLVFYDLDGGRIDETEHPFTTGYYDDVRITTHYYKDDFSYSFFSVMHEAGHGLYEQNLDKNFLYQPLGDSSSFGIHESQSRFIENLIGRSPDFWEYYLPRFKEITGDIFSDVELNNFTHAINQVTPSKIRVAADEVTYSLHIIIRFEIEQELLKGEISTQDLPKIWNSKYKECLGVDIENDSEGVLQDIHWPAGYFGYFPTYALGNIYNGQMLHAMKKEITNYEDLLRKGDLKPIIEWLKEKVHIQSNLYDPLDLIKRISGEELTPKYHIEYLTEKYSKLYDF